MIQLGIQGIVHKDCVYDAMTIMFLMQNNLTVPLLKPSVKCGLILSLVNLQPCSSKWCNEFQVISISWDYWKFKSWLIIIPSLFHNMPQPVDRSNNEGSNYTCSQQRLNLLFFCDKQGTKYNTATKYVLPLTLIFVLTVFIFCIVSKTWLCCNSKFWKQRWIAPKILRSFSYIYEYYFLLVITNNYSSLVQNIQLNHKITLDCISVNNCQIYTNHNFKESWGHAKSITHVLIEVNGSSG